ncbi:hypothetical protein DW103_00465 [Parabacteroides sp. AM08-6]|nr:hypothetical protein DW103_00465 [Parabacteroides sp. AM08-6]
MNLYSYISVNSFVKGYVFSEQSSILRLRVPNLMYAVSEEEIEYGLSVLRDSIRLYEKRHSILPQESKQEMPFFRNNRKILIGPEMEMYAWMFYEVPEIPHNLKLSHFPFLRLTIDYEALGEYCLSENYFLLRCKYEEEKSLHTFAEQMEQEYDKFFFDAEHTGFKADSRLFSLLCNACLEVRNPRFAHEKEWRMVLFSEPANASYDFADGQLMPYLPVSFPLSCIRRIALPNREDNKMIYSALAGFLQHAGLAPERYLEGLIEED